MTLKITHAGWEEDKLIVTNEPITVQQTDRICTYGTEPSKDGHFAASNELRVSSVDINSLGAFEFDYPIGGSEVLADSIVAVKLVNYAHNNSQSPIPVSIQLLCTGQVLVTITGVSDTPLSLPIPANASGRCQIIQLPLPGYESADPLDITISRKLSLKMSKRVEVGKDTSVLVSVTGPSLDTAILFINCASKGTHQSDSFAISRLTSLPLPAFLGDAKCTALATTSAPFYQSSGVSSFCTYLPTSLKLTTLEWIAGQSVRVQVDALNGANHPGNLIIECPASTLSIPFTLNQPLNITLPDSLYGINCRVFTSGLPDRYLPFNETGVNVKMSDALVNHVIRSMDLKKFSGGINNAGGSINTGAAVGGGAGGAGVVGAAAPADGQVRIQAQSHNSTVITNKPPNKKPNKRPKKKPKMRKRK